MYYSIRSIICIINVYRLLYFEHFLKVIYRSSVFFYILHWCLFGNKKYTSKRDIENRKKTLKSKFTGDEYVYMCDVHVNSSLPWLGESLLLNSGLQIAFLEGRP